MMVDDDEGDALMTREALADANVANNFHVVHDGLEALQFLRKEAPHSDAPTPDIVLLDINMPRMNGHEVLQWMRSEKQYKRTPVIIWTTSSSEADIIKSYDESANCFITKPMRLEEFNDVVQAINRFWHDVARLPRKSEE